MHSLSFCNCPLNRLQTSCGLRVALSGPETKGCKAWRLAGSMASHCSLLSHVPPESCADGANVSFDPTFPKSK
jgi:hypothetical protein